VLAVRAGAPVFDAVVAFGAANMTLSGGDLPERLSVVLQGDGAQRTLGVGPAVGRGFTIDEERRGLASGVAIVSDAFWQTHYGGAASAIGATLRLDGRPFAIVGVMPPQYSFPYEAQVWLPFALDPADAANDFAVFAHLTPGISPAAVATALATVAADVRRAYPDSLPSYHIQVMPIRESLVSTQAAPLEALTNIVAFLLLIAAVNVATLLLARTVTRQREFAVRAVLGASRARHVRQLVVEGLVLAALGCVAGLTLVAWLSPLTASLIPTVLSGQLGLTAPKTDWRVLAFAVAASLVTALVAAIVPAFGTWRQDPRAALADGGRSTTAGPRGRMLLGSLVVAETALTLVLLVGAGLVIRNFVRLATLPLGFDAPGLVAVELTPPAASYPPGVKRSVLARQILDEVRSTPSIANAGVTTVNPLGGGTWGAQVASEDLAAADPNASVNVNDRLITPGLIETMGIRMIRGRTFGAEDRAEGQPVAIVGERLAQRLWPKADPIGKRVRSVRPGAPWLVVVGVAADVSDSHDPGVPLETWYRPFDQGAATPEAEHFYVMARTSGGVSAAIPAVERAIVRADKTLAPYDAVAMDDYRKQSLGRERVSAMFMLAFGGFGLALAALGVYGVMAFTVAQRTMEFGIRAALGARGADILPLVLRRSLAHVAAGVSIGVAVAAALNAALASLLSEIGSLDTAVVAAAASLIFAAALAACLVPALRAARLDPVTALKAE